MQSSGVPRDQLVHDDDGRMWRAGVLFTGVAFDTWPDGRLATETTYRDGIEEGWCVGWHRNGTRMSEKFYVAGNVRGLRREWHENGILKLETLIGDQSRCLERRQWDSSGRPIGGSQA